jgi:hypothetical protein
LEHSSRRPAGAPLSLWLIGRREKDYVDQLRLTPLSSGTPFRDDVAESREKILARPLDADNGAM